MIKKKLLKNNPFRQEKIPDLVNINNYVCFDYHTMNLNNDCNIAIFFLSGEGYIL